MANDLYLFRSKLGMKLDELRYYLNTMEEMLESKLEKFNKMVDRKARKIPAEELDDFYEYIYFEYSDGIGGYELQDRFPELFRKSVFTSIYSSLEVELINYCKYLKHKNGIKLGLYDLKHDGITKAQIYLKSVVGIPFPDGDPSDWAQITHYNLIRNIIVHNNSVINNTDNKKAPEIRKFIESNPNISINNQNEIQLNRNFSVEFLKTTESFLLKLYGQEAFNPFPVIELIEELIDDPFS